DRLSKEILASLKRSDVVERIDKLGFTVEPRDPVTFKSYIVQDLATWTKIAQDAGIQAEE
ncbi:MAG: tripartite tricarboxylate transporter substrate binding protein, partial [Alphaproteobacteria bacterium]|nr:tripartite tricarboxylate transporter substrate binding protein [Alphaproteobacteria bacterium]